MADDFDIDKFLNESFSNIEKKLDKKFNSTTVGTGVSKKMEKVINKYNNNLLNSSKISDSIDLTKNFDIKKFNFDNVVDSRIFQEMNYETTNKKININLEHLIKPLFPNDNVFENEFKKEDKKFFLDKFIGKVDNKNKVEPCLEISVNHLNLHLKQNKFKKQKESSIISELKKDISITYSSLLPMNNLWKEYIISLFNKTMQFDTIYNKILKADLHGAIIEVIDSKNKNQLGIKGINLIETRRTFNLLTVDDQIKTILKKGSTFGIEMDYVDGKKINLKFIGDNMMYKAVERTKAKFKNKYNL